MDVAVPAITRLLLVRHGQTRTTRDGAFCGTTEVPLTEVGQAQARALAERLRREHIDALYSSPQQRAHETAAPIATALNLEIQTHSALREMNFGEWEDRRRADLAHEQPNALALWDRSSWKAHPPGGETLQEATARIVGCVSGLLDMHAGQTLLIVSHKSILRLLICHLLDMPLSGARLLEISPASLSELRVIDDQVQLFLHNDTTHLF
ncbi:MAG: histidine phosphatase family protein [Ktedonobacteraceae bacterium]|nr:histidine phosphatase family protein [Ktedonobacteraceae bacterium]